MDQRQFGIPENYFDAVMHCKDGAGTLLLQALYEVLTSRPCVKIARKSLSAVIRTDILTRPQN